MPLNASESINLLQRMIMIRRFEERIIEMRAAGKIYGAVHPYVGQEAIAVGVCSNLSVSDKITSTHRGHGHCIAKGADIKRMMAELFGRVDGYCKGRGGSMHIADFSVGMLGANGIVAGGLPIAAGASLALQLEEKGGVAVCFFGDGAATEGEFHEALNISSLWNLPIVFVCENNCYASNNATTVQHKVTEIVSHAAGYGMPGVTVDGNDLVAVHDVTGEYIARARRGEGPALIECKTYRGLFHSMRDKQPAETRPAAEIAEWKGRDPILRFSSTLTANGIISEGEYDLLRKSVDADIDAAITFADASPFPDPKDLLADMYAA